MSKTKVLLLGATGETGKSVFEGLVEDGSFDITLLVRPSSATKPTVQKLAARGFEILPLDTEKTITPDVLKPFKIILSCIGAEGQLSQLNLATAAKAAGVERFVPCGYTTICPPGGIMNIRDEKEEVQNHILKLKLPYTYIDTGYWHQISFPRLPSGKVDNAVVVPRNEVYAGGEAPNLLTDLRDIGRFVARIIKDPRTLNKRVVTWSDELSQNEIFALCEELSGEKIEYEAVSAKVIDDRLEQSRAAHSANPVKVAGSISPEQFALWGTEYVYSKYVRVDNTRENALYLGYLDARELYPDFKPITFKNLFTEVLQGTIQRPYAERFGASDLQKSHDN